MKEFTRIRDIREHLGIKREKGLSIGFVPTMGALHDGHLNLVKRSERENDLTVCSIFVNPIQFNNKDDLLKYPRTISRDLELLADACCDVVFMPETVEMYPEGEKRRSDIELGMLDKVMEGKFRPGHFQGVVTVVKKLFEIVQPARAYFGKKDFQQLAVIRHTVALLGMPVDIIPCATVREPDGLAMSSRNTRLTISERRHAPDIYQVLLEVKQKSGTMPVDELKKWAVDKIQENPGFRVEYFEIGDKDTLIPVMTWDTVDRAVAFVAVFAGEVRLIDNIELFS